MTFLLGVAKEIQINNFRDYTKMILCPLMGAATTLKRGKSMRTFKFSSIVNYGCTPELLQKLKYALEKVSMSHESYNIQFVVCSWML